MKGVKAFGETTTAQGVAPNPSRPKTDIDVFALIDTLSSPTLKDQKYKVTVANENWDGNDTGDYQFFKVFTATSDTDLANSSGEFDADGSTDYFLQINGKMDEDAQYSIILDVV